MQNIAPYKNHRFRVKWDGRYIPGISSVSALRRTTEVTSHREGGSTSVSRKSPGWTEYEPITLHRGRTQDNAFEEWANQVASLGGAVPTAEFRKDVLIELYDETAQLVLAYKVYRCWVSDYQALSDLDANGNAVAIEQIKLENEGWERDGSIAPPRGPASPTQSDE
jgi:phage tail-like protein